MFNTGTSQTSVSDKALDALVGKEKKENLSNIELSLHGFKHNVKKKNFESRFLKDKNILGADYMLKHKLKLKINLEKNCVYLSKN